MLNMPYSTAVKMLIENNYLSTPDKEKVKKGDASAFAEQFK